MQPEFDDEDPIDPFDFWKGANFKLKAKNVAGYRNYDSSEFTKVAPLDSDDDVLEAIWKKQYSLSEFVSPDKFKTYEELKRRLNFVLGTKNVVIDEETENEDNERSRDLDDDLRNEIMSLQSSRNSTSFPSEDDEDPLEYFQKLTEDD